MRTQESQGDIIATCIIISTYSNETVLLASLYLIIVHHTQHSERYAHRGVFIVFYLAVIIVLVPRFSLFQAEICPSASPFDRSSPPLSSAPFSSASAILPCPIETLSDPISFHSHHRLGLLSSILLLSISLDLEP